MFCAQACSGHGGLTGSARAVRSGPLLVIPDRTGSESLSTTTDNQNDEL